MEEEQIKEFFKSLANKQTFDCMLDRFESGFHRALQNPLKGEVAFNHAYRHLLHNRNLSCLREYFSKSGQHIFNQTITTLRITNVCLKEYNNGLGDQMSDGTKYIAQLISANPMIRHIDLSNTQLGDEEATLLLKALKTNTRLQKLDLAGNSISAENMALIAAQLAENIIQYQAKLLVHSFFKEATVLPEAGVVDIINSYVSNA